MGIAKFKKNLTYDEYAALPEKDPDTLYFMLVNGRRSIYLGDSAYGGLDLDPVETDTCRCHTRTEFLPRTSEYPKMPTMSWNLGMTACTPLLPASNILTAPLTAIW
jgi:hypothetical protein